MLNAVLEARSGNAHTHLRYIDQPESTCKIEVARPLSLEFLTLMLVT